MGEDNVKVGRRGEDTAAGYLIRQGFRIIDRNVRTRFGELDIVATRKKEFYFVEVKTRSSTRHGTPLEQLPWHRQQRLSRMAQWYLRHKRITPEMNYHLSLLGIDLSGFEPTIGFVPDITL